MRRKITDEQIQDILKLYPIIHSSRKVASEVGVSQNTVLNILHENNVEMYSNSPTPQQEEKICELYKSGKSEDDIGKITGYSRPTIKNILRKYNVEIRIPSDWLTKYSINESYFEAIDTQNKAYILGFMYADGNVGLNNNVVQFLLQARDVHILEKMKDEFGCKERPLAFVNKSSDNLKHQDLYLLSIKNKKLHDDLSKWGVVPQKTDGITFPDFIDDSLMRHFIRGVFDGDGSIYGKSFTEYMKNHNVTICGTKKFCEGLSKYIENTLNIHCCISVGYNNKTYMITIAGRKQCLKFLDWIYNDAEMYLYRKYELYLSNYKHCA